MKTKTASLLNRIALFGLALAPGMTAGVASAQPIKDTPPAEENKSAAASANGDKPAATSNKPATAPTPSGPATPSNILVEKTTAGQKLFRITEGLVVEGQRQKPNAFYVLQRASSPYDWETLEENFLPRILKAAEKAPF